MKFEALPVPTDYGLLAYGAKDDNNTYLVVMDLAMPSNGWVATWRAIEAEGAPETIHKLGNFDTRQDAIAALEKVHSNATR